MSVALNTDVIDVLLEKVAKQNIQILHNNIYIVFVGVPNICN